MMVPLSIGAVAIFIWSQLSAKKPVEKTEVLESPLPEPRKDIIDIFKENVPKVAAILGGGGAALATGGGAAAAAGGGAAVAGGAAIVGATTIGVTALPAATLLPAGLSAMAPTTLTSAVYGTTPAVVGTGSGTSSVGAAAGGSSGVGAAIGGAAMVAAPLVVVPVIAKFLDNLFGIGKSGLYDDPELVKEQERITAEKEALIASYVPGGAVPVWDPKTGFVDDPDNPSDFPGGK